MNLKLKALVYMLGFLGAGVCGGLLINFVSKLIGPDTTLNLIGIGFGLFLFYAVYSLILTKLEAEEKIKEISKSYSEGK